MKEKLTHTLADTLDCLFTFSREGTGPEEAKERFRRVRRQHLDTEMDLLWQVEGCDQSVHYDALLHLPGEGTISLSFCPDRALPWPLRGVHRWSDKDLLCVNTTVLRVDQAVACLDFIWDEAALAERLVNVCLIQEALAEYPVEVTPAELQETLDA